MISPDRESRQSSTGGSGLTPRCGGDGHLDCSVEVLTEFFSTLKVREDAICIDRRARSVIITSKRRRLYTKLVELLKPLQDALPSPFGEQEARQLNEYFQRIAETMRRWDSEQNAFKNN